jgi:hypothetical protein
MARAGPYVFDHPAFLIYAGQLKSTPSPIQIRKSSKLVP